MRLFRRSRSLNRWAFALVPAGLGLLVLLCIADYIPPGREWYSSHPMTATAISTVIGFIAISLLLERWLREREAAQLDKVSSVAYRSLAQYVNDAGRVLLSPVVGADLSILAIPTTWAEGADEIRHRLVRHGLRPTFDQRTGSWQDIDAQSHGDELTALLTDHEFVVLLFRATAGQRRLLQEGTALWAPVMLIATSTSRDLGDLRKFTDALEWLQEHLRPAAIRHPDDPPWQATPEWTATVSAEYWKAIETYGTIRDHFGDLAQLPSDEIVARRGDQHAAA